MASLSSGVLVRLLKDMDLDEKTSRERRPALLQVRGIIPIMAEGDLWPNQGFYLKVSDSSHTMYVSLPHEHDKMILNDKLQLGQLIYVRELESASPVPIIKGVRPVPGTRPCTGTPKDIVSTENSFVFDSISLSDSDSKAEERNDPVKKPVEKSRSRSASRIHKNEQKGRKPLRFPSTSLSYHNHLSQKCNVDNEVSNILKELSRISITCSGKDSDSEGSNSLCSVKPKSRRRNWERTTAGLQEMSGSLGVKHEIKPLARTKSASVSPHHSGVYDSSDDYSSCQSTRKRNLRRGSDIASSTKQMLHAFNLTNDQSFNMAMPSITHSNTKWTETKILWASLPSTLVKLGKQEVLHHRNVALLAAVEALEEAAASEGLIQCLSTYSELQSSKKDDPQPMVDSLLDLHDHLTQSRLIVKSLQNISPLRNDAISTSPSPFREAVKLSQERKKSASSWIKAALASDLSPFWVPTHPIIPLVETTKAAKKLSPSTQCNKLKGAYSLHKQRKNSEIFFGLTTVKDNPTDWVKGSSLHATADLANSLISKCRKCFLKNTEKFLDGVTSKTISTASDSQIASMMC